MLISVDTVQAAISRYQSHSSYLYFHMEIKAQGIILWEDQPLLEEVRNLRSRRKNGFPWTRFQVISRSIMSRMWCVCVKDTASWRTKLLAQSFFEDSSWFMKELPLSRNPLGSEHLYFPLSPAYKCFKYVRRGCCSQTAKSFQRNKFEKIFFHFRSMRRV